MENSIYDSMKYLKLLRETQNQTVNDIKYIQQIDWQERDLAKGSMQMTKKNLFVSIETDPHGNPITKFYIEDNGAMSQIAAKGAFGLFLNPKYKDLPYSDNLLSQLSEINLDENTVSLSETSNYLDDLSTSLDISKDDIKSVTEVELEKQEQEKEDDKEHEQIDLEEQTDNKKDLLDNLQTKQETDLNQKVDPYRTLGQILGVSGGGKLICVYSENIKNNDNHTKFSFLIMYPDGHLEQPTNFKQIGTHSSIDDISINEKGSTIEKEHVDSSYQISSSDGNNYLINANVDNYGEIELKFGEFDKTKGLNTSDAQVITEPLKTSSTYYTTPEVRENFNYKKGVYNGTYTNKEASKHEEHKEHDMQLEDVDGNEKTNYLEKASIDELMNAPIEDLNDKQINLLIDTIVDKIFDQSESDYNNPYPELCEVFTQSEIRNSLLDAVKAEKVSKPDKSMTDIRNSTLDEKNQDAEILQSHGRVK